MKLLITLSIVLLVLCQLASSQSCSATCNGKGAQCSENALCQYGYYCSGGICISQKENAVNCTNDGECKSYNCASNGLCADIFFAGNARSCLGDTQCVAQRSCQCASTGGCTCRALPTQEGKQCTDSCAGTLTCQPSVNLTTAVCVELFSQEDGSYCKNTEECVTGLYCNITQNVGKCIHTSKGSQKNCNSNGDCDTGETCNCNNKKCVGPFTYSKKEAKRLKDAKKCVQNSKCRADVYTQGGKLVICPACRSKICSFYNSENERMLEEYLGKCGSFGQIVEDCKEDVLSIWLPILIGLLIGIGMMVVCMWYYLNHPGDRN